MLTLASSFQLCLHRVEKTDEKNLSDDEEQQLR